MEDLDTDARIEAVMRELRVEFITSCQDTLDDIDGLMTRIRDDVQDDGAFMEIRRVLHSIKGQGSTFGFPLITRITHLLEDYIETVLEISVESIDQMQIFLDQIQIVLIAPNTPSEAEAEVILEAFPNVRPKEFSNQIVRDLRALVVMPKGTRRKIVGHELMSCGFRLNFANTAISALENALTFPPDIVFASMEIPDFSGSELSAVFHAVQSLDHAKFVVLTSYSLDKLLLDRLPDDTRIIHNDADFTEQLVNCLLDWGIFGHVDQKLA